MQLRHTPQTPQHRRNVRSEDAAQKVRLIHSYYLEVSKEVGPEGVVAGEEGHVQHVGIREDHISPFSRLGTQGFWRVPVVGRRMNAAQHQLTYLLELVLGERLRRVEKERPVRGVLQSVLEGWDLVTQRLAARGRRRDDDILPGPHPLVGLKLVRIEAPRSYRRECPDELPRQLWWLD